MIVAPWPSWRVLAWVGRATVKWWLHQRPESPVLGSRRPPCRLVRRPKRLVGPSLWPWPRLRLLGRS
eukprot:6481570-Amphidinium_carterae.3